MKVNSQWAQSPQRQFSVNYTKDYTLMPRRLRGGGGGGVRKNVLGFWWGFFKGIPPPPLDRKTPFLGGGEAHQLSGLARHRSWLACSVKLPPPPPPEKSRVRHCSCRIYQRTARPTRQKVFLFSKYTYNVKKIIFITVWTLSYERSSERVSLSAITVTHVAEGRDSVAGWLSAATAFLHPWSGIFSDCYHCLLCNWKTKWNFRNRRRRNW